MPPLDEEIHSLLERTLEPIRRQLQSGLNATAADILHLIAEHETRAVAEAVEAARVTARDETDRATAALREQAEREAASLREDAERRLTALREEAARDRDEAARTAREEMTAELAVVQRVLDELRAQLAREADAAEQRLEAVHRDLVEAADERATLGQELAAAVREIDEAREGRRRLEEALAQADRLPVLLRTLDEAGSFGDVLDTLARVAGDEADRAAVFLVRGDRLTDWKWVEFEAGDAPETDLRLEAKASGLLDEVVRSGRCRERASEPDVVEPDVVELDVVGPDVGLPPPGDATGRHAVGLPVSVGGSVVAVLYAEGPGGSGERARWPIRLGAIARYAGRVLEALTLRQAADRWGRGAAVR